MKHFRALLTALVVAMNAPAAEPLPQAVPPYYQVSYEPADAAGQLKLGVSYTVWIPPGVKTVRGVIVHQHGCGEPACRGGATAAYDLHWQALARKWECALLGPYYRQAEKDDCTWWCDPRQGSGVTFQRALTDLAALSRHPELDVVPWALWGHSGGANWAGTMLMLHPERVLAAWLRSGSPILMSSRGRGTHPVITDAALHVPVMFNIGVKEKEGTFTWIWTSTIPFFEDFRARGALAGVAIDPRTSHECGDSRYLAIPWLDACLAARLPKKVGSPIRPMPTQDAWLSPLYGDTPQPAPEFAQSVTNSTWLPNKAVAWAWSDYVKTGATSDTTPPPAPRNVRLIAPATVTWQADADFESGLAGFVIERDGAEIARLPAKPAGPFGRPLFQRMSYHDTPELPLPEMRFADPSPQAGVRHRYAVRAVNSVGLVSKPSKAKAAGTKGTVESLTTVRDLSQPHPGMR